MMMKSAIASAALLGASAMASSPGSAIVVNSCSYDVYLCDVPAMGGGQQESSKTLTPGEKWSQQYTQLTNGNGWSIKLSKTDSLSGGIMQYEYTWHDDGIIWYDLSDVDGNPWDGNWEFTTDSPKCTPKHQAYRYSTDDAYGMQSCPDDTTITVTLCSGEDSNNGAASAISSSVAAESTQLSIPALSIPSLALPTFSAQSSAQSSAQAPAQSSAQSSAQAPAQSSAQAPAQPSTHSTTVAAQPTTIATPAAAPSHSSHHWNGFQAAVVEPSSVPAASPTTFATSTTSVEDEPAGFTVWEVETNVVTAVVTALYTAPSRVKRHEHHVGHHHNA